jgi:hypothetical protein
MPPTIHPEPPDEVRETILAALEGGAVAEDEGWSAAALLEGVDDGELDP